MLEYILKASILEYISIWFMCIIGNCIFQELDCLIKQPILFMFGIMKVVQFWKVKIKFRFTIISYQNICWPCIAYEGCNEYHIRSYLKLAKCAKQEWHESVILCHMHFYIKQRKLHIVYDRSFINRRPLHEPWMATHAQ